MKSSIELIRLIAVLLITFTHTRNNFEDGLYYYIFEYLPTFGTAILSIVSGYLYFSISRVNKNLFFRKVKSLAIPYLIANGSILILVLILNFVFDYNTLNRLTYDYTLILEGLFSLNNPPLNPPTYFIRDIFVIFSIIALFTQKEYKSLFVLIPLLFFGTLVLRLDVAFLFMVGVLYASIENKVSKLWFISASLIITMIVSIWYIELLKYPVSFLFFVIILDLKFRQYNTSGYSYLLHLYHAPIIVIIFPFLSNYVKDPLLSVVFQISIVITLTYLLYKTTRKFTFLKILSGGR